MDTVYRLATRWRATRDVYVWFHLVLTAILYCVVISILETKNAYFQQSWGYYPRKQWQKRKSHLGLLPFKGHPYVSRLCGQTSPQIISYLRGLGNFWGFSLLIIEINPNLALMDIPYSNSHKERINIHYGGTGLTDFSELIHKWKGSILI